MIVQVPPEEILQYLDKHVSGQALAKEKLATLGYLYTVRSQAISCGIRPTSLPRLNMFLTGPTGTGKTLLLQNMAECLGVPFVRVDCASLCQVGWEGQGIEDCLGRFSSKLGMDGFGVIMLDEFDKLGNTVTSSAGHTPNLGIQYNLLDLLDGKYSHPKVTSNINNCLILCAGAFSAATKEAKKTKRSIGFSATEEVEPLIWKKLMTDSGIVQELAGRLLDVAELFPLSKSEIREVVLSIENSTLSKYKNLMLNIDFTGEDIDKLVEETYNSEYGMRELDTKIFNLIRDKVQNTRHNP